MKGNFKKLSKRTLALVLSLVMCLGMLPGTAWAAANEVTLTPEKKWDEYAEVTKTAVRGTEPGTWDITMTVKAKEQPIQSEPLHLVLVLDTSGSMAWCTHSEHEYDHDDGGEWCGYPGEKSATDSRQAIAGQAAKDLLKTLCDLNVNATVSIVTFATNTSTKKWDGKTSQQLTQKNLADIQRKIPTTDAGGWTYMNDGLIAANNCLWGVTGKKAIVMLADGDCNGTKPLDQGGIVPTIKKNGTEIFTIGFTTTNSTLQQIATDSDHYYTADSATTLAQAFNTVASMLNALVQDNMGTQVKVEGTPTVQEGDAAKVLDGTLSWNAKDGKITPKETKTIKYTVKANLGALSAGADQVIALNGKAQLTYKVGDKSQKPLDFPLPKDKVNIAQLTTSYTVEGATVTIPDEYKAVTKRGIVQWKDENDPTTFTDKASDTAKIVAPETIKINGKTYYYIGSKLSDETKISWNDTKDGLVTSQPGEYTLIHKYSDKIPYTVEYVEEGTNKVLGHGEGGSVLPTEGPVKATVNGDEVDGYVLAEGQEKEQTLKVTADNHVITFYYTKRTDLKYVVNYLDNSDHTKTVHAQKKEENQTFGTEITVESEKIDIPGYTFASAEPTDKLIIGTTDSANVINLYYIKNPDAGYTVEHYKQNVSGDGYTLAATESNLSGTVGTTATATPKDTTTGDFLGFTFDESVSGTKKSGTIVSGENGLVLKLYYTRNSYTVRYRYTGTVPDGVSPAKQTSGEYLTADGYAETTYKYGAPVTVASAATAPPGHTFSGWNASGLTATPVGDVTTYTMPAQDVTITGSFTRNGNAKYTVEYYLMGADGQYPSAASQTSEEREAIQGTVVSVTNADKTREGYTLDETVTETVDRTAAWSDTLAASGTVLRVYFAKATDWNKLTIDKSLATVNGVTAVSGQKVQPGDTLTYTVTITNATGKNLKDVKFSETPTNLTITNVALTAVKDATGAAVTATTAVTGNVTDGYTVTPLADGHTAVLTVTATVAAQPIGNEAINNVKLTGAKDPGNEEKPKPGPDPDPDPDDPGTVVTDIVYKITNFEKTRVTDLTDLPKLTVDGSAEGAQLDLTKINTDTPVVIDADGETLLYSLTVTGTPGAKYVVTDTGATRVGGDPMEGTLPDTGTATIYVIRTFQAAEIGNDNKVTNEAVVTPGSPDDKNIPTEVDPTDPSKEDPKDPGKITDDDKTDAKKLLPVTVVKTVYSPSSTPANLKAGDTVIWQIALTNPNDVAVDVILADALTVTKETFTSTESYFTFYNDPECTTAVASGISATINVPADGKNLYVKYTVQQGDVKLSNKATVTTPDTPDSDKTKDSPAPDVNVSGKTYTLTYDANGGQNPPAKDSNTNNNGSYTFTISLTEPTKEGYTFLGWAAAKDAETATMHGGESLFVDDDQPNRTIYAVWKQNQVTVTYKFDPEYVAGINIQLPASETVENGGTVTIPDASTFHDVAMKSEDGYTIGVWKFLGWDETGTITVTADKTILGKWTLTDPDPATGEVDVEKTLVSSDRDTIKWRITVTNGHPYDYFDLSLIDSLKVMRADGTTVSVPEELFAFGTPSITGGMPSETPDPDPEPDPDPDPQPEMVTILWVDPSRLDLDPSADPIVKEAQIERSQITGPDEYGIITVPVGLYPEYSTEIEGAWGAPTEIGTGEIVIMWEQVAIFEPDQIVDTSLDSTPGVVDPDNASTPEESTPDSEVPEVTTETAYALSAVGKHFELRSGETLTVEVSIQKAALETYLLGGDNQLVNWAYVYDNLTPDPDHPDEPKKIGEDNEETQTVTVDENPAVSITKTVDRSTVTYTVGGSATVNFTITVKNTGNVPLTDVIVTDNMMEQPWVIGTLAVGSTSSKSHTYEKTINEATSGTVTNVATVTSPDLPGTPPSAEATVTVTVNPVSTTYPVTYRVIGDVPPGYPTSWSADPVTAGGYHTVQSAPSNVPGTLNGVTGTYVFSGWTWNGTIPGTQIQVNGPVTITGSWTFVEDTPYIPPYTPNPGGGGGTVPIPDTPTPLGPTPDDGTTIIDEDVPLAGAIGLNDTDHFAYIIGYDDDTVKPLNNITRAEVATIFFRLMTETYRITNWSTENSFTDVKSGDWFNNAISTCANAGALKGYTDGSFKPNASITRAEFAAIAARFLSDEYTDEGVGDFSDTGNHWAAADIRRAVKAGWIKGDGNKFNPDKPITRAEVMTMVNRMLDRIPDADHMLPTMKKWIDNPEGTWYYEAVQEATNEHDYERDELGVVETWTELLTVRDWKALEAEWAANGGASASQPDTQPAEGAEAPEGSENAENTDGETA